MKYKVINDDVMALLLKNMDGNKSPSSDGYHLCFIKEIAEYIANLNLLMTTKFYRMIYHSCAHGLGNGY